MKAILSLFAVSLFAFVASAGEPPIKPARITFKTGTTSELLAALQKETGNLVVDARPVPSMTKRDWNLDNATFWEAVGKLCEAEKCRVSPYQTPGAMTLVDGPSRQVVSLDGIFRISISRVSIQKDSEDDSHTCTVNLLVMWEPKYQPYFMEVGKFDARYIGSAKKPMDADAPGQGKQELTGSRATTLSVRFPAPSRKNFDHIDFLKGTLNVVMPTRMLEFQFDKLAGLGKDAAPRKQEQDGAAVTLREVSSGLERWSFTVQIDNAPGVPTFESYQSWLGNNRIALLKDGGKTRWEPNPEELEVLEETAQRAVIRYYFTGNKFLSTTRLADWTLSYTTPHRIVTQPVNFELKNIELP